MRRAIAVAALTAASLLSGATSSFAGHGYWHGGYGHRGYGHAPRVVIGVGPGFGWWGPPRPAFGWYGVAPYYGAPYYAAQPPVVAQPPPVYIEQQPEPPQPAEAYWYYCPSRKGYYPKVPSCPQPWLKVVPNEG